MMKMLPVSVMICALMALSGVIAASRCHEGWTEISGRCFRFIPCATTWAKAELDCLFRGANLASIHNASEYHDVQQMIYNVTNENSKAWVGGSDAQQNGIWLWSDGTEFDYSSWCFGEPNNALGFYRGQACLQINYSLWNCWDDSYCSREKPYVCVMTPA